MSIASKLRGNAAVWIESAYRGEISFETASLLISAYEQGVSDSTCLLGNISAGAEAYQQYVDIQVYMRCKGFSLASIHMNGCQSEVDRIEMEMSAVKDFCYRQLNEISEKIVDGKN
jgi:hypothetical protein